MLSQPKVDSIYEINYHEIMIPSFHNISKLEFLSSRKNHKYTIKAYWATCFVQAVGEESIISLGASRFQEFF